MMAKQLDLFSAAPTLNVQRDVKTAMANAAKDTGLSREELCERINHIADRYGVRLVKGTGSGVTLATLEKWLNPEDKEREIPVKAMAVYLAATGDKGPVQEIVAPLGWMVIDEKDAKLLQVAKLKQEIEQKQALVKKIKSEIV